MRKLPKYILSGILAAAMAVTVLPAAAYAAKDIAPSVYEGDYVPAVEPVTDDRYADYELPYMEPVKVSDTEYADYLKEREKQRSELNTDELSAISDAAASKYNTGTDYFRDQLNDAEKALFDEIVKQSEEFYRSEEEPYFTSDCVHFGSVSRGNISVERANQICSMVYHSCPKYFFLSMSVMSGGNNISMIMWPDFNSRKVIDRYRDNIESITDEWMEEINKVDEPLDKEILIAKKIVDHVTYTHEYTDPETGEKVEDFNHQFISGAIVNHAAVCNGIAKTVQYFCNAAGIDTLYIQAREAHAWNMVKLYGNWYCLDVTWMNSDPAYGWDSDKMLENDTAHNLNKSLTSFSKYDDEDTVKCHTPSDQYKDDWKAAYPDCTRDTVTDESRTCTVTFSGDGVSVPAQTIAWGTRPIMPDTPAISGYRFGGWFTDSKYTNLFDADTFIYSDTTLYARMTKAESGDSDFTINEGILSAYKGNGGSVTIPADVMYIDPSSIITFKKITEFKVAEGNSFFSAADGVLFSKDKKTLVAYPGEKPGDYTIPAGVTVLNAHAFHYSSKAGTITLNNELEKIGYYALASRSIEAIPDSVKDIGVAGLAFSTSPSGYISVPESVIDLQYYNFNSSGYKRIDINAKTTYVGAWMFTDSVSLKTIVLPDTLTEIHKEAFDGCTALTDIYFMGTREQWDAIERPEAVISANCTVHYGKNPPEPVPTPAGNVVATFGGNTTVYTDLTALSKDKGFKNASGAVEITINTDLTTPQVFSFPSKATAITLTAPEKYTVNLKSASLTAKGDLTIQNLILVAAKGNVALTVKGKFTAENSTFGKASPAGSSTITDCNAGAITASGKSGETVFAGTNTTGSITVSNLLKITGSLTVNGKFTPKGDMDIDAKIILHSK